MWKEVISDPDRDQDKELIVRVLAIHHQYFQWLRTRVLSEPNGTLVILRRLMKHRSHLRSRSGYAKAKLDT